MTVKQNGNKMAANNNNKPNPTQTATQVKGKKDQVCLIQNKYTFSKTLLSIKYPSSFLRFCH